MKRLPTICAVLGVLLVVVALVIVVRFAPSASARKAWKEKSLVEISSLAADPMWASNHIAEMKKNPGSDEDNSDRWLSDRLILMRNGDWLAYANICQKQDSRIRDLFLARGSDGQWYYSTYHFCKGMVVLKMEDQAADLPAFTRTYCLRSFDGHSDECLQKTWPPDTK